METSQISSTDEWKDKSWAIHTKEYYSTMKRTKVLVCAATWMNFDDIMLSERSQKQRPASIWPRVHDIPRINKPTWAESRVVVVKGWGQGDKE